MPMRFAGEAVMNEDGLVSNVFAFLGAGFDTSANVLALTLYHIARHPEVEAKLLQVGVVTFVL